MQQHHKVQLPFVPFESLQVFKGFTVMHEFFEEGEGDFSSFP